MSTSETIDNDSSPDKTHLFSFIKEKKEEDFLEYFNSLPNPSDFVNLDNGTFTLLQYSCYEGLVEIVKCLLSCGVNVSLTTNKKKNKPIDIVARNGDYEMFKLLLEKFNLNVLGASVDTLCLVLKRSDLAANDKRNFKKCTEILLNKIKSEKFDIDFNAKDSSSENTPLHFSLCYCDTATTQTLLQFGASLVCKNSFGFMPIQYADSKILEKPLDDCIKCEGDIGKEEVNFDYQILLPPKRKELETENNTSNSDHKTENQDKEKDPERIALNNDYLLKNQIENFIEETEVIRYMSTSPDLRSLLTHPVIVSFLFIKWRQIRCLFYVNLGFHMFFLLSLITYICTNYGNFTSNTLKYWNESFSRVILNIFFGGLVLRELFQIVVSPKKYFQNFENYIEVILIVITGLILYIESPSNETRKQLASVVILLAAFEFVLMIGKHPKLSTYVLMLKTVSAKFFLLLLWSSLLIIAFAWSFNILFGKTEMAANLNKTTCDYYNNDSDNYNYFNEFGTSLFKTIIMVTGEFDTGSLHFQTYPIVSKIVFLLFVFMIAIVLLNLLNGLAVNDIQMIKNEAELNGHVLRAEYIYYVASMLLDRSQVDTKESSSFLQKFKKKCVEFLVNKVCHFQSSQDTKLTVYLYKQGKIEIEKNNSSLWNPLNFFDTNLDKATVRRIKNIVKARNEKDIIQRINDIEIKLDEILANKNKI